MAIIFTQAVDFIWNVWWNINYAKSTDDEISFRKSYANFYFFKK